MPKHDYKIPKESSDYQQMSKFVLDKIGAIIGDAIKTGENKIFIRTNLKRGLPLENINKVAGPFVEAWALEKFEAIADNTGNKYDLIHVAAGKRLDPFDIILQFKKKNQKAEYVSANIEEKIKQKLHEKGLLIHSVIDSLADEVIEETITTQEWLEMLGVKKQGKEEESRQAESLQSILEELNQVSPTDFEEITRGFFVKQGYTNSKVTQRTHDGGIDVFGSRKRDGVEESFIAQCKRTSSVGVKVARELLGVLAANPTISNGFIITSGDFTEECLRFAGGNPKLTLINGFTFANFLRQFKIL